MVSEQAWEGVLQQATSAAVPAVFRGLNSSWPALEKWAGVPGLHYLKHSAGHAEVQAMVSRSSEFFGDFEHHQEVSCTLEQLLTQAQQQQEQQMQEHHQGRHEQQQQQEEGGEHQEHKQQQHGDGGTMHLYLAQQKLQGPVLSTLRQDVPTPPLLQHKSLTSTNLWFSSSSSRSSLHYDPYENLLCVITGSKRVRLYCPAAVVGLYPKPLGGEASNHSGVDFAAPDLDKHPLYSHVLSQCVDVEVLPGDALYIPEGWWHQVDSAGMTFAVNFWWDSPLSLLLKAQPHMHHYFVRQLLAATSSEAVELLLAGIQPWTDSNITPQQLQQQQHSGVVEGQWHMPLSPPQQRQEAEERNKSAQQQKQQGVQEGGRQRKRPSPSEDSDPPHHSHHHSHHNHNQQQQQEQGSPLQHGPGSLLTAPEAAALRVLLGPASQADTQQPSLPPPQQQPQQQQHEQQQQQQQSGILVGDAWWAQQRASQQQLLPEAVAATAVEPDSRSHYHQQQQPGTQHVGPQDKRQQQGNLGLSDPVSRVLVALQPHQLIRILWEGAVQHPGQLGDLLLHRLNPAAAQLLTQALEAADGLFADSSSNISDESAAAAAGGGRRPYFHSEAAAAATADGGGPDTAPAADSSQQQQRQQQVCVGVTRQQFYAALWGTVADPAQALGVLLQHKTHLVAVATDSLLRAQLGRA